MGRSTVKIDSQRQKRQKWTETSEMRYQDITSLSPMSHKSFQEIWGLNDRTVKSGHSLGM